MVLFACLHDQSEVILAVGLEVEAGLSAKGICCGGQVKGIEESGEVVSLDEQISTSSVFLYWLSRWTFMGELYLLGSSQVINGRITTRFIDYSLEGKIKIACTMLVKHHYHTPSILSEGKRRQSLETCRLRRASFLYELVSLCSNPSLQRFLQLSSLQQSKYHLLLSFRSS